MRKIVIDIETCSYPFESLSESQQEYIVRYAEKEKDETLRKEMIEDAIRFTSLYPLTAKVIVIGIFDVEKEKSFVYYESEKEEGWDSEDNNASFKGLPEKEILKSFWGIIEVCDQVITFNGRNFDIPFLMMRSAMNRIKPSKNLLGNRYDQTQHIDLLEQFTFYGLTKKFNLDFYCNSFGVKSPKSKEVSGMEVKNLYEAGRIKDIAVYCGNDIYATYQLYKIWDEFLNI
jgi:DNA polymerase elongation subunit (family B)